MAAHRVVIEWLVQSARAYIYTTASPPAVAHAVRASLRLIRGPEGEQRRRHLRELIAALRQGVFEVLGDVLLERGWHLAFGRLGEMCRMELRDLRDGIPWDV